MTNTRQIKKVFLASPSDLASERQLVRHIIQDINRYVAPRLGLQLDLLGWEDTLPGYGRPQEQINVDVDSCDLFLGLLWKRWGTPPGNNGRYSSGFEEEYCRAIERQENESRPEICLYLKEIDNESLADPGDGLKKVLEFRERLIDRKEVLYKEFATDLELSSYIRNRLDDFLLLEFEKSNPKISVEKTLDRAEPERRERADVAKSSPLSQEGHIFLDDFSARLMQDESMENIDSFDIARFRLLANSISKSGNDESKLGVHDLNLIYKEKDRTTFGRRERVSLVEFGLQKSKSEVVPLWYWLAVDKSYQIDVLPYFTIGTDISVAEGALMQMNRAQVPLPDTEVFNREYFIDSWLGEKSDKDVKRAALVYLGENGNVEDIPAIEAEFNSANADTVDHALNAIVTLKIEGGDRDIAEKFGLALKETVSDEQCVQAVIDQLENTQAETIIHIIQNGKSPRIRKSALDIAMERRLVTADLLEKLENDTDPAVRFAALNAKVEIEGEVTSEDAKKILIKASPKHRGGLLALAMGDSAEGKAYLERFEYENLKKLSSEKLRKKMDSSFVYEDDAYFALHDKYFSRNAATLRQDIDDQYRKYVSTKIEKLKRLIGESDENSLVERAEKMRESHGRDLTRRALNLICDKVNKKDLSRVRTNLKTGFTPITTNDVQFLAKRGSLPDIDLILAAEWPKSSPPTILSSIDSVFQKAVAECVSKLGRLAPRKVLQKDMPVRVLDHFIRHLSKRQFNDLDDESLSRQMFHQNDNVRRGAALMSVASLSQARLRDILAHYLDQDSHYYNVVHWIDAGVSLKQPVARRVAQMALKDMKD